MLFDGGIFGAGGILLIGIAATALVGMLGLVGIADTPRVRAFHTAVALTYLPLVAVASNLVPRDDVPNRVVAWAAVAAAAGTAVGLHAFVVLRRRIAAASRPPDRGATEIHQPPSGAHQAHVLCNVGVGPYRTAVADVEAMGREFAFVQRRVAPYFNTDEMLRAIAHQRFGPGDAEGDAYVAAHQSRRAAIFRLLEGAARYREMFARRDLLRYVSTGTHSGDLWPLSPAAVIALLESWKAVLLTHPNYFVGITDHELPIKYHVIDKEVVILHEPVGQGDAVRLNSLFVYGQEVGSVAAADFDLAWGLIKPVWRDRQHIARWIDIELIPRAARRVETLRNSGNVGR